MKVLVLIGALLAINLSWCSESTRHSNIDSIDSDKTLALRGDLAASNRLVDHYIDSDEPHNNEKLKFWSRIAGKNGSSSGARMYAIQMFNDNRCNEARKWLKLSTNIAKLNHESLRVEKNNSDWMAEVNSRCHE